MIFRSKQQLNYMKSNKHANFITTSKLSDSLSLERRRGNMVQEKEWILILVELWFHKTMKLKRPTFKRFQKICFRTFIDFKWKNLQYNVEQNSNILKAILFYYVIIFFFCSIQDCLYFFLGDSVYIVLPPQSKVPFLNQTQIFTISTQEQENETNK